MKLLSTELLDIQNICTKQDNINLKNINIYLYLNILFYKAFIVPARPCGFMWKDDTFEG